MNIMTVGASAVILALAIMAMAEPDSDNLVINNELDMITTTQAPAYLENLDMIYSGWHFQTDEIQALQKNDIDNPAMPFVNQAANSFETIDGNADKSCASCHENVESFKGLQASMPRVEPESGKLVVMEDQINKCRTERMEAEAWEWSGADMQRMIALIGLQSRGMPMNVAIDGAAAPFWEFGKKMYYTRQGQLEFSCANCHEDNYGKTFGASHVSQGMFNGFPIFQTNNSGFDSRHSRLSGCIRLARAETFAEGSQEYRALELYVTSRGNGLSVETPAVRR